MTTLVQPPRRTASSVTSGRIEGVLADESGPSDASTAGTRLAHSRADVSAQADGRVGVVQVLVDGDRPERIGAAFELAGAMREVAAVQVMAGADGPRRDPYRLADRLPRLDADAVVVVAPRRRGARGLAAGPIVAGMPVAIVQADRPSDLPRAVAPSDPDAPWVMAAMAKNVFLDASEHWAATLASGGRRVVDLRADRARRDDLVVGLGAGPGVVLYAGHGRARGWAGYQALRLHHLTATDDREGTVAAPAGSTFADGGGDTRLDVSDPAAVAVTAGHGPTGLVPRPRPAGSPPARAVGLVMAFACGTLGRSRGRWPFGAGLVDAGLVRSYLAPASSVRTSDARALADIVVDLLADTRPATVADLVTAIDDAIMDVPPARCAWRTFRLVGRPDTPIG